MDEIMLTFKKANTTHEAQMNHKAKQEVVTLGRVAAPIHSLVTET